jgi:hypothetical protein
MDAIGSLGNGDLAIHCQHSCDDMSVYPVSAYSEDLGSEFARLLLESNRGSKTNTGTRRSVLTCHVYWKKLNDRAAVSVFSDWSLSLIPIWIIQNLQLDIRNKIVLCILMGLGIMSVETCNSAFLRMRTLT